MAHRLGHFCVQAEGDDNIAEPGEGPESPQKGHAPSHHVALVSDLIKSDTTRAGKNNPCMGKGSQHSEQ